MTDAAFSIKMSFVISLIIVGNAIDDAGAARLRSMSTALLLRQSTGALTSKRIATRQDQCILIATEYTT
jgi:hypothetical protein